jgi:hypothetical protein
LSAGKRRRRRRLLSLGCCCCFVRLRPVEWTLITFCNTWRRGKNVREKIVILGSSCKRCVTEVPPAGPDSSLRRLDGLTGLWEVCRSNFGLFNVWRCRLMWVTSRTLKSCWLDASRAVRLD